MTDISQLYTPDWAQKKPDEAPVLYENWTRTAQEAQDLAWGSDGLQPVVPEEVLPEEPEVQECPLCEETRQNSAAELELKVKEMEGHLDSAIAEFGKDLDGVSSTIDADVVRLAKILAERIIGESVALNPELAERNLANALRLAGPLTTVTLKVNTADRDRIREIAPGMAEEASGNPVEVTVQAAEEVSKGGVIVVYDAGLIDARFEHQLDSMGSVVADMVAQGDGRRAPERPMTEEEEGEI